MLVGYHESTLWYLGCFLYTIPTCGTKWNFGGICAVWAFTFGRSERACGSGGSFCVGALNSLRWLQELQYCWLIFKTITGQLQPGLFILMHQNAPACFLSFSRLQQHVSSRLVVALQQPERSLGLAQEPVLSTACMTNAARSCLETEVKVWSHQCFFQCMKYPDPVWSSWWGKDPVLAARTCIAKPVLILAWFGTLAHPWQPAPAGLQVIKQVWKHSNPSLSCRGRSKGVDPPSPSFPPLSMLSWASKACASCWPYRFPWEEPGKGLWSSPCFKNCFCKTLLCQNCLCYSRKSSWGLHSALWETPRVIGNLCLFCFSSFPWITILLLSSPGPPWWGNYLPGRGGTVKEIDYAFVFEINGKGRKDSSSFSPSTLSPLVILVLHPVFPCKWNGLFLSV